MKAYLIYFFVSPWIWNCFPCVNREEISFSRPDFVNFKITIWGLTFLSIFYKRVHLLFKKQYVSDFQKKVFFCSNNAPEIPIFDIKNSQLIARWHFYINSEDIGISKLASQLELFPSLFEFKDDDTIIVRTIIKNCTMK